MVHIQLLRWKIETLERLTLKLVETLSLVHLLWHLTAESQLTTVKAMWVSVGVLEVHAALTAR